MEMKRKSSRLLFLAVLSTLGASIEAYISSLDPKSCSTVANSYYNISQMACVACPTDSTPDRSLLNCVCAPRAVYTNAFKKVVNSTSCKAVAAPSVPSADQINVLTAATVGTFNLTTGGYQCPAGQRYAYLDNSGVPLTPNTDCTVCPNAKDAGVDGQCITDARCTGTESLFGGVPGLCYVANTDKFANIPAEVAASSDAKGSKYLEMQEGGTGETLGDSALYNSHLPYAAYYCLLWKDYKQCQTLANLCVLQKYVETHPACQLYLRILNADTSPVIGNEPGRKQTMPWLYYLNTSQDVVLDNSAASFTYNFNDNAADSSNDRNRLQFFVRKLTLDGQVVSELPLTNELAACYFASPSEARMTRYGNYSIEACTLDLTQQFFAEPQFFYELFLKSGQTTFVDVPVAVSGYIAQAGDRPNSNGVQTDVSSMRFFRRFFVFDKLSGIPGTSKADLAARSPGFIRVLQSAAVHIRVTVEKINGEVRHRIKKPFVYLVYKDVKNTTAPTAMYSEVQIKYSSDIGNFEKTISGLFIGANLLALVIVICKLSIWYQYNPYDFLNEHFYSSFLRRFVIDIVAVWSFTMFWFLFLVSAYWYIFFKWEKHVFTFMPLPSEDLDSYMNWRVVFWIMFGGLCFKALVLIWEQSHLDFFFIDWEKLKNSPLTKEELVEMTKKDHTIRREGSLANSRVLEGPIRGEPKKGDSETNVADNRSRKSAWRNIVIANEFNELFGLRYINVPFVFLLYAVIMSGYSYENLAATNTYTTRDVGRAPLNYVLKFFLSTSLLLFIGGAYYVIRKAIAFKVATPLMNFVDLCSVANISIFVFESLCHGYYIHGLNPVGASEGTVEDLKEVLIKESKSNARSRGLLINDPSGLQTFEFFLPTLVKQVYEKNYAKPVRDRIRGNNETVQASDNVGLFQRRKMTLPYGFEFDKFEGRRRAVQGYLKRIIESVVSQASANIIDKSSLYRFLRIPPIDLVVFGTDKDPRLAQNNQGSAGISREQALVPIFMKDPELSFERVMSFGHDFKLLIINIVFYQAMDLWWRNTYVALFITFCIEMIYVAVKIHFQTSNFANRTLIGEMFLL